MAVFEIVKVAFAFVAAKIWWRGHPDHHGETSAGDHRC